MNRVYYFELPVDDFERAIRFYESIFNWEITKHNRPNGPYYSVKTGDDSKPGINCSLFKKEKDWSHLSNVINVQNIDDIIAKIEKLGGEIVFHRTVINGVGYLAYFRDLDGNVFGIMEEDTHAHADDGV